jgi:hypothetical protein
LPRWPLEELLPLPFERAPAEAPFADFAEAPRPLLPALERLDVVRPLEAVLAARPRVARALEPCLVAALRELVPLPLLFERDALAAPRPVPLLLSVAVAM